MALKRVAIPSPNYSSRGGATVRCIVLHTAEGARTYQDLGAFFAKSSSQVSSHTGIDDTKGVIGEYVKRSGKAWTQANANPFSVATELCAFAKWTKADWATHPNMLDNCAQWIAEEAAYFGIPITRLSAKQAQDGRSKGVCQHIDFGSMGGGHVDCDYGTGNFPMDQVLATAKQYAAGGGPPTPTPTYKDDDDMIIQEPDKKVYQLIYGGSGSYWRTLPDNAVKRVPTSSIISDDGSLLSLWKVGAN
jgi:N-acetylmuramoyl-L-alanine amidase